MIRKREICLAISTAFLINAINGATIIFDLDGVLLKTDRNIASKAIGRHLFISYLLSFNNPLKLQDMFFDYLESLRPRAFNTPKTAYKNRLLPQIMCDWLSGKCSSDYLRELVQKNIEGNPFFTKRIEGKLLHAFANFMFTPQNFVSAVVPIKKGVALAKRCAKERDAYGNNKHRLILLSNWDRQSFSLMLHDPKFSGIFSLFDDIIISGNVGKIKPDIGIFLDLFCKWDINPDHDLCILIDNQ